MVLKGKISWIHFTDIYIQNFHNFLVENLIKDLLEKKNHWLQVPNKLSQISSLLFQTETKVSKGFEKEQVCDIAGRGAHDSTIVAFRYMA